MRKHVPSLLIYLVAPFVGEILSTSTPLISPLFPVDALLYGSSALIIREVVRRRRLGLAGMLSLGAAFGVFQEALLLRTWFARGHISDPVVADYSRVFDTNVIQAVHLTLFHAAVSTACSIAIVELVVPGYRERAWAGPKGIGLAGLALSALFGASLVAQDAFYALPPLLPYLVSAALMVLLVVAGLMLTRRRVIARRRHHARAPAPLICVASTVHFLLVWLLPGTAVAWPLGLVLTLAPVILGLVVAPRLGPDGEARQIAAITGLIVPMLAFDVAVGLGSPGWLLTATLGAAGLIALRHRARPTIPDRAHRPA